MKLPVNPLPRSVRLRFIVDGRVFLRTVVVVLPDDMWWLDGKLVQDIGYLEVEMLEDTATDAVYGRLDRRR